MAQPTTTPSGQHPTLFISLYASSVDGESLVLSLVQNATG